MTPDVAKAAAHHREPWIVTARSEKDTEALGRALAGALEQGGVVALVGPLGAGKTRLVQSIATALGADRRIVNSPTFVLIQEYAASLPVFHCDTYRLRSMDEFLDLGVDEMFQQNGVCLIEWADRVASVLPADRLQVDIEVAGPTARNFHMMALGPQSAGVLATARAAFEARNQLSR